MLATLYRSNNYEYRCKGKERVASRNSQQLPTLLFIYILMLSGSSRFRMQKRFSAPIYQLPRRLAFSEIESAVNALW